jgi:putative transposase
MPGPELPAIALTGEERLGLETLVRRHTAGQQVALRGRIILAAADGVNQSTIAARLGTTINTVRYWRRRWLGLQHVPFEGLDAEERLADAPRSGAPARITADQVCRIVALACAAPVDSERPISQWTGREVAEEVVTRGIVTRISGRHAARLLKIGRPQAPSRPLLADPGTRRGAVAEGGRDQRGLPRGDGAGRAG